MDHALLGFFSFSLTLFLGLGEFPAGLRSVLCSGHVGSCTDSPNISVTAASDREMKRPDRFPQILKFNHFKKSSKHCFSSCFRDVNQKLELLGSVAFLPKKFSSVGLLGCQVSVST